MGQQGQTGLKLRDALPIWWQVARPWFTADRARVQAWRYVSVCITLAVLHTLMAVRVSYAQKHFSTALAEKNKAGWMAAMWEFVVIICLFAPIRSLESYAEKRMVAVWRTALSQNFITAYTSNKAYFHMQLARGTEGEHPGPDDKDSSAGGSSSSASSIAAAGGQALQQLVRQISGAGLQHDQHSQRSSFDAASAAGKGPALAAAASDASVPPASSSLSVKGQHQHQQQPLKLKVLKSSTESKQQPGTPSTISASAATQMLAHRHSRSSSRSNSQDTPHASMHESAPLLLSSSQQDLQKQLGASGQVVSTSAGAGAGAGASKGAGSPSKGLGVSSGVVAGLSGASAQVDNPDQRITADVANYVQTSVGLVLLLIRKALNCAAFAGVLWSISPKLVIFLVSYAFLGTFGTTAVFGAPLTRLKQKLLRLEADLRFGLVRLRENAEAIAFYGGDKREAADLSVKLADVLDVLLHRIAWLGGYELWLVVYRYATILIPSLVLAPEYFAGLIEFGTMSQASFAFNVLEEALRLILEKMEDLSSLAAETARLAGLLAALHAADIDAGGDGTVIGFGNPSKPWASRRGGGWDDGSNSGSGGPADVELAFQKQHRASNNDNDGSDGWGPAAAAAGSSSNGRAVTNAQDDAAGSSARLSRVLRLMDGSDAGFSVEGLTACVPGRHHRPMCVCADLTFKLAPGESLLVMGPSGCGKSSLLRIIAGLWTVGSGTIRGPAKPFFLPQKPFMPLGSLRQQLVFPTNCLKSSASGAQQSLGTTSQRQQQHDDVQQEQQQQQEQQLESTPLLQGLPQSSSSSGVSTAVSRPSGVLSRLAAHTKANSSSYQQLPTATTTNSGAPQPLGGAADDHSASCVLHIPGTSSSNGTDNNNGSCDAGSADDEMLQQLLIAVRLEHLLHRFPSGLDAEVDWASVLSLGEQQRVALVRLLYHKPLLAFLDEATAALDPKTECVVYSLISQACRCYVSVGHRLQLLDWHSHVLVSAGGGSRWVKYTVAEYKQRLAAGLEG